MTSDYLHITTHDLKTHLAKYLRILNSGTYKGIVVRRYRRHVAILYPLIRPSVQPAKK